MKKIEWSRFFGTILGIGIFIYAIIISTDNPLIFISLGSLILVLGGVIGSTFIAYTSDSIVSVIKELGKLFTYVQASKHILFKDVKLLIEWSKDVNKSGLGILDDKFKTLPDDEKYGILKYGVELLLFGYKEEQLKEILNNQMEHNFSRSMREVEIAETMAAYAPSFGMIGTLIGLIIMLGSFSSSPEQIGVGLSLALLTTFYGILLSNFIFKPLALKIKQRAYLTYLRNKVIVEGIILLHKNENYIFVQDKLNSYFAQDMHFDIFRIKKDERV